MAKLSVIHRNLRRIVESTRAFAKRAELRNLVKNGTDEEHSRAVTKLSKTRNQSPTRIRNRCRQCGRSRGVYRKFGLCRIHLRETAMKGLVPGLKKSSW